MVCCPRPYSTGAQAIQTASGFSSGAGCVATAIEAPAPTAIGTAVISSPTGGYGLRSCSLDPAKVTGRGAICRAASPVAP
jgi:hypothetical protein